MRRLNYHPTLVYLHRVNGFCRCVAFYSPDPGLSHTEQLFCESRGTLPDFDLDYSVSTSSIIVSAWSQNRQFPLCLGLKIDDEYFRSFFFLFLLNMYPNPKSTLCQTWVSNSFSSGIQFEGSVVFGRLYRWNYTIKY